MTASTFLDTAHALLALPTAPFHEHHVAAAVVGHARARPGIEVGADAFGNLRLTTGQATGGLCLTAHLDHPALGFARPESPRDVLFERLGGVPDDLARDARVRVYSTVGAGERVPEPLAGGRVSAYLEEGSLPGGPAAFRVRLDAAVELPADAFAVWDLPPVRVRGRRLEAIACDDVAGVAVALAVLDRVVDEGGSLAVLLTRAEETGFGGLLAAIADGSLDADAVYVNIECSSCRAGAPLGDGPVIRVGDRRWTFDAAVTGALDAVAAGLRQADAASRCQRRLLDGGACEATPLVRSGHATGAVALPLDNYHNRGERRLRPEAIDLDDAEGLVTLLTALALHPEGAHGAVRGATDQLDGMLAGRRRQQLPRLQQTLAGMPPSSPDPAGASP